MSLYPTVSSEGASPSGLARYDPFRYVKRILPRGLFWRSLIIIVTPVVLLQGILSYVFFELHFDETTRRMARDVAADVAFMINVEDSYPDAMRDELRDRERHMLQYDDVSFVRGAVLPPRQRRHWTSLDKALMTVMTETIGEHHAFEAKHVGTSVELRVQVHDGVLQVTVPHEKLTASSADIFIVWMVGSAFVLVGIAVLFLRNQVRPIERLAFAAENFGKGRSVPDFKPYGASEVRRAAQAFITMRARIERHVTQRTEMLAGVSHDLKTPLSRLKLQLAMMGESTDIKDMRNDISEMERMLDEYLAFARGEGGEEDIVTDLGDLVSDAASAAVSARGLPAGRVIIEVPKPIESPVKRQALRRCVTNLIDNALKHGKKTVVTVMRDDRFIRIIVDDDGPGIPPDRREEAFRPFHRLDQGRNLQVGGVGLGLAIARDIARGHGGDLLLDKSPMGGLRAIVRLPV
jgi:two-component system osmolarity sensor histidine kinase EnvZ